MNKPREAGPRLKDPMAKTGPKGGRWPDTGPLPF